MTVAAWSVLLWAILYLQCCWENKCTDFTHKALERWTYSRGPVKGERGAHVPCRDFKTHLWGFWGESHIPVGILLLYIAISWKVVGKNAHATIPNGHMGYDQYTVLESLAVNLLLLLSFGTHKHTSIPTRAILSNFFGEQWTENHPRYLSGLSRALFPTTFLEIAVYNLHFSTSVLPFQHIFVSFVTILTVYTSLSRHVHLSPRNHWFSCEMMATEHVHNWQPTYLQQTGSLHVSGKLPTYPSPKPTFCPKWEVSVNVGLGEG